MEYNLPAGAYPLHDFHKTCRVCTPFQDALAVKIGFAEGVMELWGFKLRGLVAPNVKRQLAAKLCVRPKRFRGAKTCSRSSITMPSLVGLGFHPVPWRPKTLSFYRQHCAQSKPPVFSLLRGRFWGFSPSRGDTLHRWGWNLARGRGPQSPPPCQISPPSVQRQGCRTPKIEMFTQIWPKCGI